MRTRFFLGLMALGIAASPIASAPAGASVASMTQSAAAPEETMVIQVARAVRVNRNVNVNRNVRVNRNVNVYRGRGAYVNRGLYRGRYVYRGGVWARPRNYWWPVGGAVAAGAALGMITAAAAMPYAGPPPGAGYCWYYTDPGHTQGFWDRCP